MIPADVLSILEPLVKEFEGCKLIAYKDPGGVWTIGYGHTGLEVREGLQWDQAQADSTLATDLAQRYSQLVQYDPSLVFETPGRQAALTDFVYNLGIGTYLRSTLRQCVIQKDWEAAKLELGKWNHEAGKVSPGLSRRRDREINLIG